MNNYIPNQQPNDHEFIWKNSVKKFQHYKKLVFVEISSTKFQTTPTRFSLGFQTCSWD